MTTSIIGWDIGGANIKAARISEGQSRPVMHERAFPLWREPARLSSVLVDVAEVLGSAQMMAITMTAELADCFANKREGVASVLDALEAAFPDVESWVYGTDDRFRSVDEARRHPYKIAAANWMAGATFVAQTFPDALFLDVGSTTSDIIPIVGGRVVARGRTDPGRLRSGELVYTGALRTPIAAIVRTVPFRGRRCRVAAEYFASSADVHRWLGCIGEDEYTCDTPDGRGRSRSEAGARLARMVCADFDRLGDERVTAIAEHVSGAQVRQIASGLWQVVRRLGPRCPKMAVIAGLGKFLARAAADAVGLEVTDLADAMGPDAARATPAAAVAYLLNCRRESPAESRPDRMTPAPTGALT
ncbi:MAG: H4MPT-linked C1 transfer pathway protein [Acidobacteria bacterium]|nr:H4MPT-linked C1 transfer pathway protein [Acidobacteriota bacterium]